MRTVASRVSGQLLTVMAARLDDLVTFTEQRAHETNNSDFLKHAAMYRCDSARLRILAASI